MPQSVIWINGTFGVGKTHTAYALHARLPGSFVFDPEEIGYTLQRLTPPANRHSDFQDHPLWIPVVIDALVAAAQLAAAPIIVPMTLSDLNRHAALIGGLRAHGLTVHHFTLMAPPGVVYARLRRRFEGRTSWAGAQVTTRLSALANPAFATHLNTQGRSVDALALDIAVHLGLTSTAPTAPAWRRWWHVTWAHRR